MKASLWHYRGLVVSSMLIRCMMREQGLSGPPHQKKWRRNLVNIANHEDLKQRNLTASSPNSLWFSDITDKGGRDAIALHRARQVFAPGGGVGHRSAQRSDVDQ